MMPTYNQIEFVGAAIRSVVEQDYPNLHVVVSDDGSTDGSADVIVDWATRYPDRVTGLVGGPNLGVTQNCNRALARCRGELRAFHAGDDLWLPGKVTQQVEWLAAHPSHVLCGHDVDVFDSATGASLYPWSRVTPLRAGASLSQYIEEGNPLHPISIMVRASALPGDGFDTRIPLCSDWKFFIDCLARGGGRFGYVDGIFARYRQWSGNVSKRENEMLHDLLLTLDLVATEYPETRRACNIRRSTLLYHRGRTLLGRGDLDGARRALSDALAAHPTAAGRVASLVAGLPQPVVSILQSLVRVLRAARSALAA